VKVGTDEAKTPRQDQVVLKLIGRSRRDLQRASELRVTISSTAIGDIRRNCRG
jgi:hypothetical protein